MDKVFAIFDMDGTLLNSMPYWRHLDKEFCRKKGIDEIPQSVLEKTAAMTMEESAVVFIEELGIDGTPETIANEFYALMGAHYAKDIQLKDGVREYLDDLSKKGVKMCAASATPKALLEIVSKRLGIDHYFSFILSCEEVGAGKSSPKVYLEAARRLGAKPEETAVFEDSNCALQTALHAGFYGVAIYDEDCAPFWEEMVRLSPEAIRDWRKA